MMSEMSDENNKNGEYLQQMYYAFQQIGGGLMQQVLNTMDGDTMKQERFMQCMICDRKYDCAVSAKPEPPVNKKTGLCSRLLLPGETRSVGETRGRKKGSRPKKPQKYPKGRRNNEDPIRKWLRDTK